MESDMEDVVYSQPRNEPVEARTHSDSSISELSSSYNYIISTTLSSQQPLRTISARPRRRRRRVAPNEKLDEAVRFLREELNWSPGEFIAALAKSSTRKNKRRLE